MTIINNYSYDTDKCFDINDEEILQSVLVKSIKKSSGNLEKIRSYEIEEMENQDPQDVL
jgi:hypothetical protein